jgi:ABC-type uncharacterized transport system permease subunit
MSLRRLSVLQWFGTLGAAAAVAGQFLAGAAVSQAVCNPGSALWGVRYRPVELALGVAGVVIVLAAEGAAFLVFRATRGTEEQDPPPEGRLHFFATAALAANFIFLMIVALTTIVTIANTACRQS